jgi:DNA-binding NtrC family response regulator
MAGEFVLRIWSPGAVEPAQESVRVAGEVALDRELLAVHDGTVSRTANAPKLRPVSVSELELEVSERSARTVLVIEGLRFEALQHPVPPGGVPWKIAPGQLSRPGRLARGRTASLALVRQLEWERPGPTHHLLLLPRARRLGPGETTRITAPALIVIGEAALDVTPSDTLIPPTVPGEAERAISFRLSDAEDALEPLDRLDRFPRSEGQGPLRAPELEADCTLADLTGLAQTLLDHGLRDHAFFPVLEDERRPRLALGYRRSNGTTGVVLSGPQPVRFVAELATFLAGGSPRASASMAPPPRGVVPVSTMPAKVIACYGSVETRSPRFAPVLAALSDMGRAELGILFLGESGTGKEYLASVVHEVSLRSRGPFVAINCSALSDELVESELFGHKKGSFTGAHSDRAGAFVAADGGTLLLDEIGDAPAPVQVALLRALETRRVRPVGSDSDRAVDVRVLAATSRNLEELMESGAFRRDLYYRLAELTVEVPALRERREDVPALAELMLRDLGDGLTLSHQAESVLMQHDWPGNVRELRNALKRAVALSRGAGVLQATHFAPFGAAVGATLRPGAMAVERKSIEFPAHVVAHAERAWKDGELGSSAEETTQYEQRALHRAVLLCLVQRERMDAWPRALEVQWRRLFGEKWATSEDGRGLRELVREVGMDPRDGAVRERVWEMVGGGGGARA